MKRLTLLLIISIFFSCKKTEETTTLKTETNKTEFDWLVGNWVRKNDKDGKQTFERWKKKSNTEFIGIGYTLLEKDTVWKEDVRLSKTDTLWTFAVTGKGDTQPTVFKLSKVDERSFIFENNRNEFPKRIEYTNKGNAFSAVVSGDGMTIPFEFEKEN
jgi:hypothetical protein